MTRSATHFARTTKRRIHAAMAVTLATFLLGITGIGFVCRGYNFESPKAAVKPAARDADQMRQMAEKNIDDARRIVDQRSNELAKAEAVLADFIAQNVRHWPAKLQASTTSVVPQSLRKPDTKPSDGSPIALTTPNPRWQQLHDQLQKLKQRRTELLESFQPAHPTVQSLNSSIEALESQLSSIPAQLPAPAKTDFENSPANANSPDAVRAKAGLFAAPDIEPLWRETSAELERLAACAADAQANYREAVRQERLALKSRIESLRETAAATFAVKESRNSTAGASPHASILWCGVFSLAVGLVVGWNARYTAAVFHTAAEVRKQLGLTVLGLLPFSPGQQSRQRPPGEPRWIGRMVAISEWFLVAVAAVIAIAAATDRNFLHTLLANPLAACSQKWWC